MATITSAASGNWSNTATWVGGVVPTAADDVVIASSHIIQADVDINVLSITRTVSGAINISTSRTISCPNGILCNSTTGTALSAGAVIVAASSPDIVTINANLSRTGGTANQSGATLVISGSAIVNINGNISNTASTNTKNTINITSANSTVNITGNITTGGFVSVVGGAAGSTLNLTGTITGGSLNAAVNVTSTININGIVNAASQNPAIIGGLIVAGGVINNVANRMALSSTTIQISSTINTQWLFQTNNALVTKTLYDVNTLPTIPTVNNVRNGVTYASGALTGTLVVPAANAVTAGVTFDNGTVGTAQNTAASFLTALAASSDPLAVRLKNVATVQTTSAQITAAI